MTRLELEARRMQAIPLLDSSMMQAKIARTFGVSRTTVSRWKRARAKGNSLKQKLASGRPSRMSAMEIKWCKFIYPFGPLDGGKWTQAKFAQAIKDNIGIEYHPDHVGRLMHQWGLRPKRERKTR
jgi:putative transposase